VAFLKAESASVALPELTLSLANLTPSLRSAALPATTSRAAELSTTKFSRGSVGGSSFDRSEVSEAAFCAGVPPETSSSECVERPKSEGEREKRLIVPFSTSHTCTKKSVENFYTRKREQRTHICRTGDGDLVESFLATDNPGSPHAQHQERLCKYRAQGLFSDADDHRLWSRRVDERAEEVEDGGKAEFAPDRSEVGERGMVERCEEEEERGVLAQGGYAGRRERGDGDVEGKEQVGTARGGARSTISVLITGIIRSVRKIM
jgi:hypothetical protein